MRTDKRLTLAVGLPVDELVAIGADTLEGAGRVLALVRTQNSAHATLVLVCEQRSYVCSRSSSPMREKKFEFY